MNNANVYFTKEHEWVRQEDDLILIGISNFAQESLGDIVYLEVPSEGDTIEKGSAFGVVESIKSVSDLYAPVDGNVVAVNSALVDAPEKLNEDPYHNWILKVRPETETEVNAIFMNAEEYQRFCQD